MLTQMLLVLLPFLSIKINIFIKNGISVGTFKNHWLRKDLQGLVLCGQLDLLGGLKLTPMGKKREILELLDVGE